MIRNTHSFSFTLLLFIQLCLLCNSNIWDNIFSQTQSSCPIIPSQSFNFKFQLPQQYDQMKCQIDLNLQLNLLTVSINKNIIIQQIKIFKAQFNLDNLILTTEQFLLGCQRFTIDQNVIKIKQSVKQIQLINQNKLNQQNKQNTHKVNKNLLFLINLIFKYTGKYTIQQKTLFTHKSTTYNKFQLSTQLFQSIKQNLNSKLQQKQQIKKINQLIDIDNINNIDQKQKMNPLDQQNINFNNNFDDFKIILLVDQKTGQIKKVYKNNQMKQELHFQLNSNQKKQINCKTKVKKLTIDDLKKTGEFLIQNKGDIGSVFNLKDNY